MGLESEEIAQDQLTKQQLDQLLSQMEDKMKDLTKSAGNESKLATAQSDIQQIAQSLNQQMTTSGLGAPSSLAFSGGSPSTGSSSGTGGQSDQSAQEGQAGTGSGNESSTDGGSGNEPGSGSGSGSGSGNGSGSGSGSGTGTGSGSSSGGNGAGLGAGNHNLTVPKQLNGQENQEIDKGELGAGESEQQIDPNAPILPGEVRSYGEVFEQYENTYRQAIQRNNYPDHLQEMIKDYFSDIKPTKGAN